jgi:Uncharacterised nucleotidyltransferase
MPEAIPQEFLLAAACCRWPPSAERNEAVRSAATPSIDWKRFLRVAARHRIIGLANDALRRADIETPQAVKTELAIAARELARTNLEYAAEAFRLCRLFTQESLSMAVLKGAPLALLAYGNLALRHSRDIDVIVRPEDLDDAIALLERGGYRRSASAGPAVRREGRWDNKPIDLLHTKSGSAIELHWEPFTNPHLLVAPLGTVAVPLPGGGSLTTLRPDDLFAYLCAHGAKHGWFRLKWLADIGALLAAEDGDGIARLYGCARARGVDRPAAQALLLSARLLATPLPAGLAAALRRQRIVTVLERTALRSMVAGAAETEPTALPFGTTRIALAGFLIGRGWRYPVAAAREALASEDDRRAFPLPDRLQFLYPILRAPLWFWRRARAHRRAQVASR